MPTFSFVVPVYNVAPYLRECINSILNQQYANFEVCIVDDGSSDGSDAICDEYAAEDHRVRGCHQENKGVSVARNKALDMATGEFIWFVDADDYIERNSLKYLDMIINKSQCDTIFFGNKRMTSCTNCEYETGELHQFLCSHVSFCNPLMIFKRSIIESHHLRFTPGMKMAEDLEFQYKYLLHSKKPIAIPHNLYYIRERGDSASRSVSANQNNLHGNKLILENILEYVQPLTDKGLDWLGMRMAERTKSLMQSAAQMPSSDTKEIQKLVRFYVNQYKAAGFEGFDDWSFRLACIDVRIYFTIYKLIIMTKSYKR